MPDPYPPMSPAWQDGYRQGMEYCLSVLDPLLDDDDAMPAVRKAVRMLHGQTPAPPMPLPTPLSDDILPPAARARFNASDWQCSAPEPCPRPGALDCHCAAIAYG